MEITIKQLSQQEISVLRDEIQSALDLIKTRYGLSELVIGGITFNKSSFSSKIVGKVKNDETVIYEQYEAKFFAEVNGLPVDYIGSEFILDGDIFKITQLKISHPKYPIIAHCKETGKTFKFSVQRIKELLQNHRVINIT